MEQRDLLFALGALAFFHHRRRRRLDLDLLAAQANFRIGLARFFTFFAQRSRITPLAGLLHALARTAIQ